MKKIPYGCVMLARKIQESEIWIKKPSWWYKTWTHILMKVNHRNNPQFKRGTSFFNAKKIYNDCYLCNEGIKEEALKNFIKFLKKRCMITTQKTTRGFILTVCNYEFYQNLDNYRNPTENSTENPIETRSKLDRNSTINNNVNNVKNGKNVIKIPSVEATAINQIHLTYNYQRYKDRFNVYNWARLNQHGYVILAKNNPPSKGKTIAEHKWIFENIRKIPIVLGFVIYHKDNNKANNNINNLLITSLSEQILARRHNREPEEVLPFSQNSVEFQLSKLLFDLIRERKRDLKEPNLQEWSRYIDYMIRRDNRKPEKIREVINWCQKDEFWQNNILSTKKLRKQFDQLELRMRGLKKLSVEDFK